MGDILMHWDEFKENVLRVLNNEPNMPVPKRQILEHLLKEYEESNFQNAAEKFTNLHKIKKFAMLRTEACDTCGTLRASDFKDKHNTDTCYELALKDCIWLGYKPSRGYYCVICL